MGLTLLSYWWNAGEFDTACSQSEQECRKDGGGEVSKDFIFRPCKLILLNDT